MDVLRHGDGLVAEYRLAVTKLTGHVVQVDCSIHHDVCHLHCAAEVPDEQWKKQRTVPSHK
eukprot:2591399-Amphidinium_carterae.1